MIDTITTTGAAGALTSYLLAAFKLAWPSAPSWALVVAAGLAGILSVFGVSLSQGDALTMQSGASWVIQGIFAAAVAGGLTRTDGAAQAKREQARIATQMGRDRAAVPPLPKPSEE